MLRPDALPQMRDGSLSQAGQIGLLPLDQDRTGRWVLGLNQLRLIATQTS
jgi:hypothetical protein